MTTITTAARTPSLLRTGVVAVVATALATALTHLLLAAAGADFRVMPPGQTTVTVVPVALAAAIAAFAAVVGLALTILLARRAPRRAERVLLVVTAVVLVVFAINPVLSADQVLTVVALEVEHLVAAGTFLALVLPALRRAVAARAA